MRLNKGAEKWSNTEKKWPYSLDMQILGPQRHSTRSETLGLGLGDLYLTTFLSDLAAY